MDIDVLKTRAAKIAGQLGIPSDVNDVLSELYLMSVERPNFHELTDAECRRVIARNMCLNASYYEVNESETTVTSDGEEMPTLLQQQTHDDHAENLMLEIEHADFDEDEEAVDAKEELSREQLNALLAGASGVEEDVYFLRFFLGYDFRDIGKLLRASPPAILKIIHRPNTTDTLAVFDDGFTFAVGRTLQ